MFSFPEDAAGDFSEATYLSQKIIRDNYHLSFAGVDWLGGETRATYIMLYLAF